MSFDKGLWARLIDLHPLETYPLLPCPYCNQRKLAIDEHSLTYRDLPWLSNDKTLNRSLDMKRREVASLFKENEFIGFLFGVGTFVHLLNYTPSKFVGFFLCGECGGDVAVAGTAMLPGQSTQKPLQTKIKIEYFSPPVPMFSIHPATPRAVANEVLQAFQHFHCDLTASGAKLRRAMEKVCEALGHKKRTLHDSIEAMSKEYPAEGSWLRTLKLVGNEATHSDGISEDDLLTSFHVLEAVLDIFRRKAMAEDIEKALPTIEGKFKRLEG